MEKLDLRKQYKHLYHPSAKKVEVVEVPSLQFAMVDGAIPPDERPGDSADFHDAVAALYGISYTLKFMLKKRAEAPIDYPVMWLEGLWATASGKYDPAARDTWLYTAMIMQPDIITPELFEEAQAGRDWKLSTKGRAFRSCISALLRPNRKRWPGCIPSPLNKGIHSTAATTKFTSATRSKQRRRE